MVALRPQVASQMRQKVSLLRLDTTVKVTGAAHANKRGGTPTLETYGIDGIMNDDPPLLVQVIDELGVGD